MKVKVFKKINTGRLKIARANSHARAAFAAPKARARENGNDFVHK